ncbi:MULTISPECIES: phasin family protein [unclassified Brevundimonas]|uniref:phasin family protein n=1 Tax=unclassified Brevundimonas TaxID=2622653 RepID=UPI003B5881FE
MSPIDEAARAARAGQELLEASGDVIARRLTIMAEAVADPAKADLAELTLMGSEKLDAMTKSARIGLNGAAVLAQTAQSVAARETAAAGRALEAVLRSQTPTEMVAAHSAWAADAWTRTLEQGWAMGAAMLKLQTDALQPIHAAAVANAERLRK